MMDLSGPVLQHANRGVRLQLLLRGVLVVFLLLTIGLLPPVQGVAAYYGVVVVYALGTLAVTRWAWRGGPAVARWGWLGLFADLVVLAGLVLAAGVDAEESWTSYVLLFGFFVLPVLAATQLRVWVCAAVVVPTVIVYCAASFATQAANDEPWQSIVLRTLMLATVGAASVGLARIQRSRLVAIVGLLEDRTRLLDELVHLEERERRDLAERLHDGALQYVLAARLDLDDVLRPMAGETVGRIDHALGEASRMLRATVSELHPSVLRHAGLVRALRDLAGATARQNLLIDVDVDDWPAELRTAPDGLLFGAARELLSNVVKHSGAHHARISLARLGDEARLVVADDGHGMPESVPGPAEGHIGLQAQRLRVGAAGGTLVVDATPSGTVATVTIPLATAPASPGRETARSRNAQ